MILIATALAAPLGSAQAPVPSSISSAIDNGASQSLAGLLPTSEAYQRAMQVVEGLKAGIPSPAPVATAAQLDDITAFTRGAVKGAMADPTVITTSDERARMRDFAKGYLSGALTQLASSPSVGRAAVDEAVAKGVFTGVTAAVLGPEPIVSGSDIEAYGRTLAAETFDEMDKNGALLADLSGSPALADITLFASDVSRGQLESAPTGIARAQLDAIANFGAGTLDGMVVGVVSGFPQGVPAPAEADLRRWFQTVAEGHSGTAPWTQPASLPLLLAWADASAAAAVTAVDAARESVTGTTPPSTLDEIGAWAVGVAHGAYERLDSITAAPANVERDVRAYAEGVTAPGIEYLLTRQHPNLDDAAVTAYAEGLTGGVDDLRGASIDALGLTRTFLEDLSSAVTSIPSLATPTQSATMEAYLTGVTDRLTVRMDGIAGLIAEDDPALLAAMAEGLATGAVGLAGGPAMTRPELAQALGNGLAGGFLESRNPRVLAETAFGFTATAKTWIGATPPASLASINDLAQSAARDPYAAIQQYGTTMGRAPVSWSENKSLGAADQGWGGADDLLWLAAFTNASAPIILEEIKEGLGTTSPQPTLDAMNLYVGNVTGSLGDPDLGSAIGNLTSQEYRTHARRFAQFTLTPTDWVASKDERAAAREVLRATLQNASGIERFRDAEYAVAAIAFLKATGDGIKEGRPDPRQIVKEAKGEGFLPPWVDGVVEAIREVPTQEVRGDISGRVEWIKTATSVVRPIAKEAVGAQVPATKQFAMDSAAWALSTPERLPDVGQPDLPLLAFLNASINATLTSLPAVMTEEEQAAVVAYADGIQRAVWAIPALPSPLDWGVPDQLAMEAYVGGIASGAGQVQDDTRLYLCSWDINVSECPADDEEICDGECPGPGPDPEPECEFDCEFMLYLDNLGAWSENLTAEGVLQMEQPNATPTRTGIAFVTRWSAEVLAGHGVCPDFESATFECDGPRGPVAEFAQARNESVAAWAEAISQGYNNYIDLSDPPNGLVRPLTDPILAWAAGVQNAVGVGLIQPERFLPAEGGDPATPGAPVGAPPQDPSDPAFREELRVWTDSVLRAPGKVYDTLWVPFPDTSGFNATVMDLDYIWAHVIWEGGYDALNQSETNLSRMVINATPDASLDAFAEGLVNATRDIMIDPAAHDLELLLGWYQGLAEGGVEAILEGAATIRDEQVPGIAAYAEYLAGAYGPPAPPTQSAIEFLLPPDRDEGEEEEEEPPTEEPPAGPSAEDVYLANLQAHAQGLAEAVLQAPVKPLATNATAYGGLYLAYVQAIAEAAQALPPVSPDAGFPARLSAWTQAQAAVASRAPAITPERLGPNPNTAMALGYVESFAGTSPWNLPPDAQQKLSWAQAAIDAGIGATCPSTDPTRCALIGEIVGEAFGMTLPQEIPASPIPLPEQIALLEGIANGAAQGLGSATGGAGDTALVTGLVEGLVPEGANAPTADDIAAAVATALGPHVAQLPVGWTHAAASELSTTLLSADPARYQSLANGAAALIVAMAQSGETDPGIMEQQLRAFLAPTSSGGGEPSVRASDGVRTAANAQLTGALVLDGLREIRINLSAPASSPIRATWELAWSASDARGASATRIPLAGDNGAYSATFAPAALASLPRGAIVHFVVIETSPTGTRTYPAQGDYAFKPDRDAPTATLNVPATASGASFVVSWAGQDGDSAIASYRVESRDGQGDWREWIRATSDPRASFTGVAGHTYSFRATATDAVGHASAPSAIGTTAVPNGAPANVAPTISFVAPAADAVFGRTIEAIVTTSDADGTPPTIRVCIRKADANVDLSCPYEGARTTIDLDASALTDGRYRLHAYATDGTLTAEALSPTFAIDRSPPTFRGAIAEADPTRVLLSASLDDASAVTVLIGDDTVPLSQTAPGVWSGQTTLTPGEHTLRFRATDPNGNDATLERSIVVPAPAPPPTKPGDSGTPTPPTGPTTPTDDTPPNDTPGAPLLLVLAALGAAAFVLRRRR